MKKLITKLLFIFFMVTVLSVMLYSRYLQSYKLTYHPPQNLWIYPEIQEKYTLVKLGNSHAQEGITLSYFKNIRPLELASVAQSFEYDLAHLKMYRRQIARGAVILINVSPISFSQKITSREDNLQTKYYASNLSPFLIPHIKIEDYLESQIVPFYRTGFSWRWNVNQAIAEATSKEEKILFEQRVVRPPPDPGDIVDTSGFPAYSESEHIFVPAVNAPPEYFSIVDAIGYELDHPLPNPPNLLGDSKMFIANKWTNTDGFGKEYFKPNIKALEKLIAYAKTNKWRPVLLTVPISKALKNQLPDNFLELNLYKNLESTNTQGTDYFDFMKEDKLIADSHLFIDSDHLNHKGATIVSYLLLRKLIDYGYFSGDVDGYNYDTKLHEKKL